MRIAVIDVAAESGGALSVLNDFVHYVRDSEEAAEHQWYVFTSLKLNIICKHVHNIVCPEVKKSWGHRLIWEKQTAQKLLKQYDIDIVISLQNTAVRLKRIPQIVYFHNVLLLEEKDKYSFFNKAQRKYAIYTHFIAPYTLRTLNKASAVITQTDVVKSKIMKMTTCKKVIAIRPNIEINESDKSKYEESVKGLFYPAGAVPFKQFEELVECCKKYNDWFEANNYEIVITINGNENAYAQMVNEKAKPFNSVKLVGYLKREDVLAMYRSHALFINSEMESYPIPFLEAQYFGDIIIAGDYDYATDILSEYKKTLYFEKHNIDAMFEAIKKSKDISIIGPNPKVTENNTWEDVIRILLYCNM